MAPGSLTLACLLLAVDATGPDGTEYLNSPKFDIPITVAPEHRGAISALELYMSRDRGQSWDLYGRVAPDRSNFPVTTPGDGAFWFSVVVVYSAGRREPSNLRAAPVGQRVVVDTTRPDVRLTAERQGDEIAVTWDIRDENLDLRSLKIEWSQGGMAPVGLFRSVVAVAP